jgi:hypothetical protein
VVWTAETLAEGERCELIQHPAPTHNDNPNDAPHIDEMNESTPTDPVPLQDPDIEDTTIEDELDRPC